MSLVKYRCKYLITDHCLGTETEAFRTKVSFVTGLRDFSEILLVVVLLQPLQAADAGDDVTMSLADVAWATCLTNTQIDLPSTV